MTIKRQTARALLITREGKVCLIRRVKNGEVYWVTPGGSLECGETPRQAVLRELREEVGADLSDELCQFSFDYETDDQKHYFFTCYEDKERITPDGLEHMETDPSNRYDVLDISIDEVKKIALVPAAIRSDIVIHLEKALAQRVAHHRKLPCS